VSSAAQRLAPAPAWFAQIELVLARAASEVRILSALTPCDARGERVRLTGELRAGRPAVPCWTYANRPHDELRRALGEVQDVLERSDLTALEALYLDRARELALEAAMCASAGTRELAGLARSRFEPRERGLARAASALCGGWLAEPPPPCSEAMVASDSLAPTSLLSRMKAAVGRYRLPFSVVTSPWLAPLAATGERVILVTTGRLVPDEDAVRTVLHEIEGHARPRARSMQAASAHFRIGTARGIDDQEGRAILLEEQAGFLGPRRRKQLAARHWAVEAMLGGASFADVASALVCAHGLDAADAVVVAERAFRGGDGTHPGLGRERVYLESMLRVRRHLAAHPEDDAVLASGQVAVSAADTLRPFIAAPHREPEAAPHREPQTPGAP
jgi:hypothetical protein